MPRDSVAYADIRSAIECALADDEIVIGEGVWTGDRNRNIEITTSLSIRGAGPGVTVLDAESQGRHFLALDNLLSLRLASMTLRGGLIEVDPAISIVAAGGSISFGGDTLQIDHCRFEDNAVRFTAEGGWFAVGGAIFASRASENPGNSVQIVNSVFLRNTVHNIDGEMDGAAIEVSAYDGGDSGVGLLIERSSFLENRSLKGLFSGRAVVFFASADPDAKAVLTNTLITSHDGANYAFAATRADLQYSTLVGFNADALFMYPAKGRVSAVGSMILGLGTGTACWGDDVISGGYNIDTDGTCGLTDPTDLAAVPDPHVTLVSDTGPQPFLSLDVGSPAIDAGAAGCSGFDGELLLTDQIGRVRPLGPACDIGAIESVPVIAPGDATLLVVASGSGSSTPCPEPRNSVAYADIGSAVECALEDDEIVIGEGTWTGARNRNIEITKSLRIRGAGPSLTVLDAESQGRHFTATDNLLSLRLASMTLRGGLIEVDPAISIVAAGGSIWFGGDTLQIDHCRFEDNAVRFTGEGGWYAGGGAIMASRLSENPGNSVQIVDSVFLRNTVHNIDGEMNGAAIEVGSYDGGDSGVGLLVERSSFLENRSQEGMFSGRAVVYFGSNDPDAKAVLTNTLITSHDEANYAFSATRAELQYSTLVGFDAPALILFSGESQISSMGSMILGVGSGVACLGGDVISGGYNIDTDGTCGLADATDLAAVPDPHVTLVSDTGPQPFLSLDAGSPAIDAGAVDCSGFDGELLLSDQIGRVRPLGSACDIGAIESVPVIAPGDAILGVEASGSGSSAPCPEPRNSVAYADIGSAVECALEDDEIVIGEGTWTGARNRNIAITKSLRIHGAGPDTTILDAELQGRHFTVQDNLPVSLGLALMTLRGGLVEVDPAINIVAAGGSIAFGGDALHIDHCRFEDNAVRFTSEGGEFAIGGAIMAGRLSENPGGSAQIIDSVFLRNTVHNIDGAMNGAAIEVSGYDGGDSGVGLLIERSSFLENRSLEGEYPGRAVVSFGSINPDAKAVLTNTLIASHDGANYAFGATRAELQYSTLVGFDAVALDVFPGESQISSIGSMILGLGSGVACWGDDVISAGYNLDTDGTCGLVDETDLGAVSNPRVTLVPDVDPQPFLSIDADSPAIDAGAPDCTGFDGVLLLTDQTGSVRPQGSACDIGAIESVPGMVVVPGIFADNFEVGAVAR